MSKKKRFSKGPQTVGEVARTQNKPARDVGNLSGSVISRPGILTNGVSAKGAQRRASAKIARRRQRRIRIGLFTTVAAVVLAVMVSIVVQRGRGQSLAGDSTSPTTWVLPRLGQSGKVSLASLRGRPTVVNMFASWCTVCQTELPVFTSEARLLRGKVTFVEVNSLETGNGLAMAQQYGLAAAGAVVLSDVGGAQHSGLHDALGGGNNMPVSAFYSATGKLLASHVGGFTLSSLQAQLRKSYGPSA